jgi:hypothetical protein
MKLVFRGRPLVLAAMAVFALAARAEIPRTGPLQQDTLQAVLDRIREHAANDAWKRGGLQDDAIEKWLDKLVGSVAKAAEFPDLKLPVRLVNVRPPDPEQPLGGLRTRSQTGVLIVGKNVDLKNAMLRDSIVLADGSVEIESARGCVIVARGAITVRSMSSYSVLVSGVFVKIAQFDGEPRVATNGSLIVSRGRAEIGTAYGSLIVAPDGVGLTRASTARDAVFINTPLPPNPRIAAPGAAAPPVGRAIQANDLPLERMSKHSMAAKLELLGVVKTEATQRPGLIPMLGNEMQPAGVVFRYDGRRYVADLGQPIIDEAGEPIEPLQGWKLTFAGDRFAVFSRDDADAIVEFAAR